MTIVDNPFAHGDMRARHTAAGRGPAVEGTLRLSPAAAQIIERVRSRAGLGIEVINADLEALVPEAGGELIRAIEESASARAAIAGAMQGGRSRTVELAGGAFLIQPIRAGHGSRRPAGLLACRRPAPESQAAVDDAERWLDFLRVAIEAESSASEGLRAERLQARRTIGVLRFVSQLAGMASEAELARGVVHAAAVWFDVDARLYRRDRAGDFQLHTHLPGIGETSRAQRLSAGVVGDRPALRRLSPQPEGEALGWALPEAVVVPVVVEGTVAWALILGGVLPPDALMIFQTVGDALGAHLSRLAEDRRKALRRLFEATTMRASRAPELTVIELLRQVMAESGAASGAVTLFDAGGSRRLAAVGPPLPDDDLEGAPRRSPGRLTSLLALGESERAVLDLATANGEALSPDAVSAAGEAAAALRVVLLAMRRQDDLETAAAASPAAAPAFVERISQEVERAKRFDLGLSMLLIDVEPQSLDARTLSELMTSVRAELRGSDVLGMVGQGRIAVLLVHTDVSGVGAVVARVRQRLQPHSARIPALRLGRAVLSNECATTTEFLSQASRNVEAVAAA